MLNVFSASSSSGALKSRLLKCSEKEKNVEDGVQNCAIFISKGVLKEEQANTNWSSL